MILSKLDKLSGRERAFLIVAALVLLGVLVDRLVVKTVGDVLREMQSKTAVEISQRAYIEKALASDAEVDRVYVQVRDRLARTTTPAADIDVMKGEIDDLARQSGLVLTSMKHREPRTLAHHEEYVLDIGGFEGSMENLLKFLNAVERSEMPGLIRVSRLNVSAVPEQGGIKGALTISKVMVPEAGNG